MPPVGRVSACGFLAVILFESEICRCRLFSLLMATSFVFYLDHSALRGALSALVLGEGFSPPVTQVAAGGFLYAALVAQLFYVARRPRDERELNSSALAALSQLRQTALDRL